MNNVASRVRCLIDQETPMHELKEIRCWMLLVGIVAASINLFLVLYPVLTGDPLWKLDNWLAQLSPWSNF